MVTEHEITRLIDASAAGDRSAAEELWQAVYAEIHGMAAAVLSKERPTASLQPTLVVNEIYLRIGLSATQPPPRWENRRHFFGSAARAMEQFLIDHARARNRLKRGGGLRRIPLEAADGTWADLTAIDPATSEELVLAVRKLEEVSPLTAEIARLKFICGLTIDQVAMATDRSSDKVVREWAFARAWLLRELSSPESV